ncbi:MAG TPA: sterol desaturase family protein [Bryobacteraceae bacterium]|nr:sterol desaturase family protein [Bryobacteraceae bacterium]
MEQFLASHEVAITWWVFVSAMVLIGLAETFRPRRDLQNPTGRRWIANGLLAGTHLAVYALLPAGATLVALFVQKSQYGLLNRAGIPLGLRIVLAIMVLDLSHYAVHYLLHRFPWLWRVHQVHHSDPDFDLTTGVRTHPFEVFLTEGANLAAIALLAPPPVAVIALGIVTAMQNLFSHANLHLPEWFDAGLRRILVTPDVHRIHHSESITEQNTNFGFVFPWWDRLFGTYLVAPAQGHRKMGVGLRGFQDGRSMNILHLLAMPFRHPLSPVDGIREPEPTPVRAAGLR